MSLVTLIFLAGAILPVAILLVWTVRRDRLPEPPRVVLATFALGALTTIPILIVNVLLVLLLGFPEEPDSLASSLVIAFISAAYVEELFKFAVIAGYAARHDAFDEPYDGIVYGVAASLGFAMVENVLYVFQSEDFVSRAITAAMRAVLSIPLHANCGALIGLGIGIARGKRGVARSGWILGGLVGAIVLHGTYNSFAFASETPEFVDRGLETLGVIGVLATAALGAAVVALAAARLRRDQLRARARSHADFAFAVPSPLPPDAAIRPPAQIVAPTSPSRIPLLPILSLVLAATSGLLWVGSIAAAIVLGSMAEPTEGANVETSPAMLAIGCGLLVGLGLALASLVAALVALIRRTGWTCASVVGLITSALILLVGFAAIAVAMLTPAAS